MKSGQDRGHPSKVKETNASHKGRSLTHPRANQVSTPAPYVEGTEQPIEQQVCVKGADRWVSGSDTEGDAR
jgi:hypothetical protein